MKVKNNRNIRLYIFKSNKHIYAHLIDDKKNKVLTSSSTVSKDIKNKVKIGKNCATAQIVGQSIGLKIKQLGIKEIFFDRGKNLYHGQVKAIADATREQGIIF
uniref:Large ribosomal subunit protein uL18c n=1 Tax=Dipterosiphonia australica TaxID=2007208 RepID=A0A1Z1MLD0_9FLOR|nr:ribosomal protein L18 [Dipterosiphonia australica]ARW66883.1 ribosomal protein L18 [Dipterosiphonia australica]